MIFCILVLTVALLWFVAWYFSSDGFVVAAFIMTIVLLVSGIVGSVIPSDTSQEVRSETHSLQAMDTRESSGSYRLFLNAGYNNGQPGFNYLRAGEDDGTYVMRFAQNWQATVHTDEEEAPYVDVTYYLGWNPLWVPWPTRDYWNADFHVPENSVSNEIVVAP